MQSSILFCCTETNNILRAVSSREDAVFSIRTFTWSWCLPVSRLCRSSYDHLAVWSSLWHKINQALAFEADICTRWKSVPVQWFSELFFDFFLRILAIDIVVFIDVIDLSNQIIEFGKDCDDRYWKSVNVELERWVIIPFPALAVSKNSVSSDIRGRALFRTTQNLSPRNWPSVASM